MSNYQRFAGSFIRALNLNKWIPETAEVTATRNPDGTITIAWDSTIATNQRGEILVVDNDWVPAAGGSINLTIVPDYPRPAEAQT